MKKLTILSLALALLAMSGSAFAAGWTIDPAHSSINFSVKHMVITTVHGEFKEFDGTVNYEPEDLSTLSAEFTAQAASIDTDNDQRDGHLRSGDFFLVEEHPTLHFKSSGVKVLGPGEAELTGDLMIRGVTKPVTFKVDGFNETIDTGNGVKTGGTATATINRHDYGVSWNKTLDAGGVVVGDDVKILIELELNKI
jgi:polyisoprenoid-binding protein YceI